MKKGKPITDDSDETYVLTPEAALWTIVKEWNLGEAWNPKIYRAAFEDFMDMLVKSGCVEKKENKLP